jgi:hypothetical protein
MLAPRGGYRGEAGQRACRFVDFVDSLGREGKNKE